ncbi:hypothetical protein BgiMline_024342 [Biomphalaria glabrata]
MGSQDSVIGPYCLWRHTLFPCDHGQSRLRHWSVLFMATHSLPPTSWAVKTPSLVRTVYGDTLSFPAIMGSQDFVIGPYCLWRHTLFPCDHGQSRLRHWSVLFMATHSLPPTSWAVKTSSLVRTVYGDTLSSPDIMGSQDSVIGPYCLWRHTLFPCDHGQSRLRHWSVLFMATHSLPLRSWAVKTSSLVRTVYGDTLSSPAIMGSQDFVIGPYCLWRHTLFPRHHGQSRLRHWSVLFMATHSLSLRSWAVKTSSLVRTVYGDTLSSPDIMGSQDSVIGPYCLWRHTLFPCDHGQSRLRHWSVLFMATHSLPLRSWAVKTPSLVRTVYGNTLSSPAIMGSKDFDIGPYCLSFYLTISCPLLRRSD